MFQHTYMPIVMGIGRLKLTKFKENNPLVFSSLLTVLDRRHFRVR